LSWLHWKVLAHDAVDATLHLVAEGHDSAARGVRRVTDRIEPIAAPVRAIDELRRASTGAVLGSVHGVNRAVERLVDTFAPAPAGAPPVVLRSDVIGTAPWLEDAALGLTNGAVGDRLRSPLDLGMQLRHGDLYLPPTPSPRDDGPSLVVLVHGLATTEWSWCLDAGAYHGDPTATFGTLLSRDLGLEPLYARYNTGRSVATNGRALSERLEALASAWRPARIVLLGHSMGGLVARSACHEASRAGHRWIEPLTDVVSLGTPHQGAPLAGLAELATRTLGAVDLPATRVISQILEARSAGIHDLSLGADEPLLPAVRYTCLSATLTADPAHPLGQLVGDLLVRVVSASGPRDVRERRTLGGVLHHQIQCHPEVYSVVRSMLGYR
jgi:pimeloyl-ACP methyl ester carboxylesterase